MLYDLINLLDKDFRLFYELKSRLYAYGNNSNCFNAGHIIDELTGYGSRKVEALIILFDQNNVLHKVGAQVETLRNSNYKVDLSRLENLAIQLEGLKMYFSEKEAREAVDENTLIASLPFGPSPKPEYRWLKSRIRPVDQTILDLIHGSTKEVIIMSPFFDSHGLDIVRDAIFNRIKAGIRVEIITRYLVGENRNYLELFQDILHYVKQRNLQSNLILYDYENKGEYFRSSTFHAKTLICDEGARAYLGSSNFTGWGLAEQLEIGVVMEGRNALYLKKIIEYLKNEKIIRHVPY